MFYRLLINKTFQILMSYRDNVSKIFFPPIVTICIFKFNIKPKKVTGFSIKREFFTNAGHIFI